MSDVNRKLIESVFDQAPDAPDIGSADVVRSIEETIRGLDRGELRVVEKGPNGLFHNEWLKKAILLYFRVRKMSVMEVGDLRFVDKIPLKQWKGDEGVRVVPHALVRRGAHIASGAPRRDSRLQPRSHQENGRPRHSRHHGRS